MEKEFIPYEQAVALKELGFAEHCLAIDNGDKLFYGEFKSTHEYYEKNGQILFQQVFRWFRENYNLHSEILLDQTTQPKFCFEIYKYEDFGNYEEIRIGEWFLYRTYEEAELACLIKLIEIVKNK